MREFEDADDGLQNPESATYSLPSYTYARFFDEYPKTCVMGVALFTVVASMYFWRFLRTQRNDRFDDVLRNGRFSHLLLKKIRQKNANQKGTAAQADVKLGLLDEKSGNVHKYENSESEEDDGSLGHYVGSESTAGLTQKANTDFRSVRGENVSMVEALENAYGREKHEGMASLGELHGKLATADLRAKARKLEKAMSEKEWTEEQIIRQKQLESICEMIMQRPEKFGVQDKTEIMEQMKLYSI